MIIKHSFTSETELRSTLDWIYSQSLKGTKFHGIIEAAFNEITIITAIHNIKSNKGANTPGTNGETIDDFLHMEKEEVINLIQKSIIKYKAKPVKRVYIEKSNGKLRPLGLPNAIDKIIQECLRIIIEPIVEAKFFPNSYGFRPYRATKHAIKDVVNVINNKAKDKPVYAIEGDIESFFDCINHRVLLKQMYKMGISDKRVLSIIKQMLKAGYIEYGIYQMTEKGTVQGGIISPLLANIYLNNFDWIIGKMYQYPERQCKHISSDRRKLRNQGIQRKYLIRYCDDWIILTTTMKEAKRLLKYLIKYFKYRLKLKLSQTKTVITNLLKEHGKFLGWIIKAGKPRKTPARPNPNNIVGKHYPDFKKIKEKTKGIVKDIKELRNIYDFKEMAVQIERINSKITGLTNYHKTSICSNAFKYIDDKINNATYKTFKSRFGKKYKKFKVPLKTLSNRPQRHKGYETNTYAVEVNGLKVGITKAFITHSKWLKYPYNQKKTPYTEEGRIAYMKDSSRKYLQKDRPPIYDIEILEQSINNNYNNFEFYMNREYAYNRDRGKCKVCGRQLKSGNRHCHRIENSLKLNMVNKVSNLAWFCKECDIIVHGNKQLNGLETKVIKKVEKYRERLNKSHYAFS